LPDLSTDLSTPGRGAGGGEVAVVETDHEHFAWFQALSAAVMVAPGRMTSAAW
jgi:hypothetical protein